MEDNVDEDRQETQRSAADGQHGDEIANSSGAATPTGTARSTYVGRREGWAIYGHYSQALSANARKLAYGAAGLAWALREPLGYWSSDVKWGLRFLIGYFAADLLHYFSAALVRRIWLRSREIRYWRTLGTLDGDYSQPDWLDYPATVMTLVKITSLGTCFYFLGRELM